MQDPEIRSRVLPLFSFDPAAPDDRPKGHGTAFRIDPWSRCATAFHVLEDLFQLNSCRSAIILRPEVRLAALEIDGLACRLVPIPNCAWRPLAGSFSFLGIEQRPFGIARLCNMTELIAIRIRPPAPNQAGTPYLPLDFRRWRPRIGEGVLALGYADLDNSQPESASTNRPMSQYLYGSLANIIDIEPANGARARPWPMIRIDANWPVGMSGGPVLNEAGHVVGVVSTGFKGEGGATATFFSGWNIPERIFGSIDPVNPGRFYCWGVFDCRGALIRCGQDKAEIERFGQDKGLTKFAVVSVDPSTGEYVSKSEC